MKKKILVAEDYGDLTELLKRFLEDEGFEVLMAFNGEEAWEIIQHQRIDLMVTDYNMPKMNGTELTLRIKNKYPNLPVILSSTYAPWQIGLENKVMRSFLKPYDINFLLATIHKILS